MNTSKQMKLIAQRMAMGIVAKEKENIRTILASAMMAATLITLHDKYDWKPEQLLDIMAEIFDQFECVSEKFVKIQDFYDWLETIGITVTDVKERAAKAYDADND